MSRPLVIRDLKAELPVIQGGMGVGVSLAGLAGAVAKCGGIGVISTAQIGYQEPEFDRHPIETNLKSIKTQISRAKEIAEGGIVGVNIMVATRNYAMYVKYLIENESIPKETVSYWRKMQYSDLFFLSSKSKSEKCNLKLTVM